MRNIIAALGVLALIGLSSFQAGSAAAATSQLLNGPPPAPYEKASAAIKGLPDFIPTMGMTYVEPKNLPDGPYLGYSRDGKLVDTVYMIPIREFDAHRKSFEMTAPAGQVDHIGIYFNPGHPGMPEPHYHIVLWHVPRTQEALVAK